MYLLYDILLLMAAGFLIPYYLLRGIRFGKTRRGIRERLGFYLPERLAGLRGKRVIWVHAVSVGETRAAIPLIKGLKANYPNSSIVLTNVTETGHSIARGIRDVDLCLFFPFDLSWVVRRALSQVRPAIIIIVETEIWPNFVRIAKEFDIPVILANGRISDRSFPRYRRVTLLLRPILQRFSAFCMQTQLDAERIGLMGAPRERVEVTRNLKFDMQAAVPDQAEVNQMKAHFGIGGELSVLVAGSTHAGEEEPLVDVYRQLLAEGHPLLLILIPRHPERCRIIAETFSARGIPFFLRSRINETNKVLQPGDVLLVDTLGEMLKFYSMADLVFLGGSLVPVGGHNVLEASLLKKPVLFGPHMSNFKEIARLLIEVGGGMGISDPGELRHAFKLLLEDPDRRRAMGEAGFRLLRENAGATDHTLGVIARNMGQE